MSDKITVLPLTSPHMYLKTCSTSSTFNYFFFPSLPHACSGGHSSKECLFSEMMLKQNRLTELREVLDKYQ